MKLESEQTHRRRQVDSALSEQRRDANAEAPSHATGADMPPRKTLCVRGVETFASTAGHDAVLDDDARLDPQVLGWLSRQATRAVRRAEVAHAGPGLPQRLGRMRSDDNQWQAIEPPTRQCKDSTAYAALALDSQRPTAAPDGAK